MAQINILVVDDSAVVRQVLSTVLNAESGLNVYATASDPIFAMERMQKQWPDVIVLDVEMPRMDGISFLKKIMAERPTPVVICSTLTEKGAQTSIQAMDAGAVDIVTKPKVGLKGFLESSSRHIIDAVKGAAAARMSRLKTVTPVPVREKFSADAILPQSSGSVLGQTTEGLVAIGTSTGGTQALEAILPKLPRVSPGIVIVQHMPEKFTAAFAHRLNSICQSEVKEAVSGDRVMPGRVLIAPGGKHMILKRSGAQYQVQIVDGPLVNRHKPSVDVLFRSVAKEAGKNALGIILTGMGDDGAKGLLEMKQVNSKTIAQDEATSVVYGMPNEAVKCGAVDRILPLEGIANAIMSWRQ